jgi:hypothetical protein
MDQNDINFTGKAPEKLTDWEKEPDLRELKQDLESGRTAQQMQVSKITHWNDLLKVRGAAKPKKVKGRSGVQPKLIRRQAEWRYSALSEPFLGSNKVVTASPVTGEDAAAARQSELVINYQFRTKLNRVKLIDDFVRSTVDDGTSILRVGWKRVTVPIMETVPVYDFFPIQDEQQLQEMQQMLELKAESPRMFSENVSPEGQAAIEYYEETGMPVFAVQNGTQEVPTEKVLENKPTVDVLNPANVVIDPSCNGDMEKAMFCVVSFETSKADLLKEPNRYKNLDSVNWDSTSPATESNYETSTPSDFQFTDSLRKKVVAYEYWGFHDIDGQGVLTPIVATWIGNVMVRLEENPFPDAKLPLVVVPYLPVKRDLYGEPDAELLEDNQAILGAVTRGMIDLLGRSANSQQGFAKGMLDPLNRRRFDEGQDYEFNPGTNPQNNLIQHKYPELPQSALIMSQTQNQEAEALTGVKSFGGGISGEAYGDVATGIKGVLDAASKREMAILRRLAKGMTEVFTKIMAMNAVFLSEEEVIRITDEEFVTIKREDLVGNYDVSVEISTAEVDNAKTQDLAFMLQTIGPNTDPGIVMMMLAEIADLKRMPDLARKIRNFKPQPDPLQEQLKQLEVMKAQKEVELLDSEIRLNDAKAQEAMSKKDKTDLDYVEQETGTKHAREMEQQKAQSEGNQNLQVTKALTTPTKEGERAPNIEAAIGYNRISDKMNSTSQELQPSSTLLQDELVEAPLQTLPTPNTTL